jgi:predicted solute-binding protein
VSIAPCSSICLISQPKHELALPLGISTDGSVLSVYLALGPEQEALYEAIIETNNKLAELFQDGLLRFGSNFRGLGKWFRSAAAQITRPASGFAPPLALTPASASSAALSRFFYKLWFGDEAYKGMMEAQRLGRATSRKPLELLIGDEALVKRHHFTRIIDLGAAWKTLTGLPFVFAVWQSRGQPLNGLRKRIQRVGEFAENRMHVEPTVYLPDNSSDDPDKRNTLLEYWRLINYRLQTREFQGLIAYLCLARSFEVVPVEDVVLAKIIRWQELSNNFSVIHA